MTDTRVIQAIDRGVADVDMRNSSGASALIVAAAKCHPEAIKVLIEEGAK